MLKLKLTLAQYMEGGGGRNGLQKHLQNFVTITTTLIAGIYLGSRPRPYLQSLKR